MSASKSEGFPFSLLRVFTRVYIFLSYFLIKCSLMNCQSASPTFCQAKLEAHGSWSRWKYNFWLNLMCDTLPNVLTYFFSYESPLTFRIKTSTWSKLHCTTRWHLLGCQCVKERKKKSIVHAMSNQGLKTVTKNTHLKLYEMWGKQPQNPWHTYQPFQIGMQCMRVTRFTCCRSCAAKWNGN